MNHKVKDKVVTNNFLDILSSFVLHFRYGCDDTPLPPLSPHTQTLRGREVCWWTRGTVIGATLGEGTGMMYFVAGYASAVLAFVALVAIGVYMGTRE